MSKGRGMSAQAAATPRLGGFRLESGDAGNVDIRSREELGRRLLESKFEARIVFHLPRDYAEIIYSSITPEVEDIPSRRTSVNMKLIDEGLSMRIKASDPVALRAALNSFLRFIDSILETLHGLDFLMKRTGQ